MRKHLIRSIILTLCVLFVCCACQSPKNTKDTQPTKKVDLEIVYKRNQLCYSVMAQGDDTNFYVFNAAAQPIYDIYGLSVTAADLAPGMKVSLEYDGYVLETYPLQFSGVSSIRVTDLGANNVEFLSSMISGMFPSSTPSEIEQWEVTFAGDDFLNAKEKRALEYFLNEKWEGAAIKVEPTEDQANLATVVNTLSQAGFKADAAELSARFGLKLRYEAPPAGGFAMTAETVKKKDDLTDALEEWLGPMVDQIAAAAELSDEELERKVKSGKIVRTGDSSTMENAMAADMERAFNGTQDHSK